MRIIINGCTNPYFNLAVEEYLFHQATEDIFMLWQDEPCIVIGKNQNTLQEINYEYVTAHQIPVVRRLSGGGAVFHDLGNLNFTFIQSGASHLFNDFQAFTKPILEVLQSLGVNAEFSGRNDLLIDGRKFSGNAQYRHKDRILHHGTLLFSSAIQDLSQALKPKAAKFEGKSVKSVVSRVTNISEHLPQPLELSAFITLIQNHVAASNAENYLSSFTPNELAAIELLKQQKYETWSWNYGESPQYNYMKEIKFSGGLVTVHLDVQNGLIQNAKIYGDFFGIEDVSALEARLCRVPHSLEPLKNLLDCIPLENFFSSISREEFLQLLI